jgi:hypothetical protein
MQPSPTSPKLPAILIANDLLDGDVVFWTGQDWSCDPHEAAVAQDAANALAFEEAAREAFAQRRVVDAYLVDITPDQNGVPVPNHFRERFRVKGPSHRLDLGKQARFSPR